MTFDIIGDIAIIKMNTPGDPLELAKKILEKHKHVKTVLLQVSKVDIPFRVPKYKYLLGEKKTETIHKEFGLRFKVDVTKCYYSPRLENERMRIAKQVKENEEVLVMFSGVNPYPIYIAKFAKPKIVYSIEINPFAVKYGLENEKLNKVDDKIKTILGDVRDAVPLLGFLDDKDGVVFTEEWYLKDVLESGLKLNKLVLKITNPDLLDLAFEIPSKEKYLLVKKDIRLTDLGEYIYKADGIIKETENSYMIVDKNKNVSEVKKFEKKFDRIVMPLPKEADTFLDVAIPVIKNNGIIHLYQFLREEEIDKKPKDILDYYSKKLGFKYKILNVVKCGDIAPRTYRVCIDFQVYKG